MMDMPHCKPQSVQWRSLVTGWQNVIQPKQNTANMHSERPSESYLTPPRRRGLGNESTPVSHHITIRLQKVDENVDLAKFRRLCSAFPHLGFGVPCWCGVGGPRPGVSALLVAGFVHWVSI